MAKEDEKNILDKEFVVLTYIVIDGKVQAKQIYVGFDVPGKSYLDTIAIQISSALDAEVLLIALTGNCTK